jgi:ribosomal protein S18 acetylase RimI-like enzyme
MDDKALQVLSDHNLVETYRQWTRQARGGAILEEDELVLYAAPSGFPAIINGAIRTGSALSADEVLERARTFFGRRKRGFTLYVREHADADLEERLRHEQRLALLDYPVMVVEAPVEVAQPEGATVRRVADDADVQAYLDVTGEAFGVMPADIFPPLFGRREFLTGDDRAAYVAYVDGEPVSAAMTVSTGRVAGVYFAGTKNAARRRGFADACVRLATNAGFEMGARVVTLQATSHGEGIYERIGYRIISRCCGHVLTARAVP